jgi:hypothetical protein
MSKSPTPTPDLVRELRDDELENVSGGKMHLEDISLGFSIDIGTSENLVVNASSRRF